MPGAGAYRACGAAAASTMTGATRRGIWSRWSAIIEAGRTPAEEMLDKFNGPWGGSVEPAYSEYAF